MKKIVLGTTSPDISKREKQHHELAREAAREGIVLLKNEGMLPLKCKKLALYGSGARQTVAGGTGSGAGAGSGPLASSGSGIGCGADGSCPNSATVSPWAFLTASPFSGVRHSVQAHS